MIKTFMRNQHWRPVSPPHYTNLRGGVGCLACLCTQEAACSYGCSWVAAEPVCTRCKHVLRRGRTIVRAPLAIIHLRRLDRRVRRLYGRAA